MTSLPDWLVERAALDEVPPASRERIAGADPRELADRIAALRDNNADELTRYPAGPAVAEIDARVATERRRRADRKRRRRVGLLSLATCAALVLVVLRVTPQRQAGDVATADDSATREGPATERLKSGDRTPRLLAFRLAGAQIERLEQDSVVRAGDVIQLRYKAAGQGYGVIASLDGAGVVTLHFPLREDAPPQGTAMATETTALPNAYALDDAPRFERFFFITGSEPIDVQQTLTALRSLGRRGDGASATLELPGGMRQWTLRLRKPDRTSTHHETP